MASSARKTKTNPSSDSQLQLLYADDAISKYWSSSLFNTVYLRHDISDKHSCWKNDDDLDFQNFINTLRNISAEYKNREKELSNWSETETINNWVKHVLHALGWTNNCSGVQNPFLEETSFRYDGKTYRTDILIVDHPKEKQYVNQAKGDDKLKEARRSILMPVEVKYWQRLEEYRQGKKEEKSRTDNESDDIARTTTPNEQTIQYMEILKKNWGILTDGAKWRLFNTELSSEDAERYYEFNFASLFQAMTTEETEADSLEVLEAAKYFYHFFSKFAFYPRNEAERPFVEDVLQYSKKYVNRVEEDLKERFVKAMNIACNGFYRAAKKNKMSQDQSIIRNVSESALFNILFIKSLESRGVLPMASTDYKKISISSIIDKIERFDPEKEDLLNIRELERAFKKGNGNSFLYDPNGDELHDRILRLTSVIHKGTSTKDSFGFEIAGFKESIFSKEEWEMFKTNKISNHDWTKILFELGYGKSESLNRKYQQIPYAYFTPRQLGSIYESFLEFKLDKADDDMVFENKQWKSADVKSKKYRLADLPKVSKGELFFTPDNEDRKASGSYYTPDKVVELIIKKTMGPMIEKKSSNDILKMKICDPAMGSGHFLAGALRFLSWAYLNNSGSEEPLSAVKAKVLHSCIYGVDKNSRAVKLAKLAIWLESASPGGSLENLDDQFYEADSLMDENVWRLKLSEKFDAVIGNPPYINTKLLSKHHGELKSYLTDSGRYETCKGNFDIYIPFVELSLSKLIKPDGCVGFVLPNKLCVADYAEAVRKLSLETCSRIDVIDVSKLDVFQGVGVYPTIYIWSKANFDKKKLSNVALATGFEDSNILSVEPKKVVQPESGAEVWSDGSDLNEDLESFGNQFSVEAGIPGYQAQAILPLLSEKKTKGAIPFIVSGCINKGGIDFSDVRYMKHKFKVAYLTLDSDVLSEGKISQFKNSKIVIAGMTKSIRAAYCEEPLAIGVGVYCVSGQPKTLKWLTQILNSITFTYVFRKKFEDKHLAGGYLAINAGNLLDTPLPQLSEAVKTKWSAFKGFDNEKDRLEVESVLLKEYGIDPEALTEITDYLEAADREILQKLVKGKRKLAA